jgi:hypothetical protein
MRAVVGEKALSDDEHKYLEMLNTFEAKFLSHDSYENRNIKTSSGSHDNHDRGMKRSGSWYRSRALCRPRALDRMPLQRRTR